jgi:hypothetical protein
MESGRHNIRIKHAHLGFEPSGFVVKYSAGKGCPGKTHSLRSSRQLRGEGEVRGLSLTQIYKLIDGLKLVVAKEDREPLELSSAV